MKDFFKMMFASSLGVLIAGVILSVCSFVILIALVASFSLTPVGAVDPHSVLKVDLTGVINEQESNNPFNILLSGATPNAYGLNDILTAIREAKTNDKIKGIYLKAGICSAGYATLEPIREALFDFKESGKFIVAYGENYTQNAYYVASVADQIYLNPGGMFDFSGLGKTIQFNKNVYKNWGIEMQVFKVGTYKSAIEPDILDKMSDANREQTTAYLHDIWGHLLEGIADSRGLTVEQLNHYADQYLAFTAPEELVSYGLIDELRYASEVEDKLKELTGIDRLKLTGVKEVKLLAENNRRPSKDKIAVLYAEGTITGDRESFLYSDNTITAHRYVKELNKLRDDASVKAVVFRVNSPGGSAFASEQIWRAVQELQATKPVVVSMGDYAASGGYYISCAAGKIVAEPTTLTGSIGIFGRFPSGEALAQKMGATYDGVGTNKHSRFGSEVLSIPLLGIGILPARALNQEESNMMQAYIERGYDSFVTHCAEGRGKTKEEIDAVGQGRVWTGSQALALGLVDELGGVEKAISLAAQSAQLGSYQLVEYPQKKDFFTQLMDDMGNDIQSRIAKAVYGQEAIELRRLQNAWQHYDCRQAIMEEFIK